MSNPLAQRARIRGALGRVLRRSRARSKVGVVAIGERLWCAERFAEMGA
jgi:hypothetical protein